MKIAALLVENLGSLYGKQEIDFERAIGNASLFLITGPTGAGKSTLLDAIMLALFGQTPRLDNGRARPDELMAATDPRQIVSEGTGYGRTVVELWKSEGGQRRRYRASWYCQRARQSPTGKWQEPQRELDRLLPDGTWERLAGGKRGKDYAEAFAELVGGMRPEEFQRSVLLAQGEFAAFLQAGADERGQILERLTRTDTYRRLGQLAAARFREVEERRRAKVAALDALVLATDDELLSWEQEASRWGLRRVEATEQVTAVRARHAWCLGRLALLDEEVALRAFEEELAGERRTAAADLLRLQGDRRVRGAEGALREARSAAEASQRAQGKVLEFAHLREAAGATSAELTATLEQSEKALAAERHSWMHDAAQLVEARARRAAVKELQLRVDGRQKRCEENATELSALLEKQVAQEASMETRRLDLAADAQVLDSTPELNRSDDELKEVSLQEATWAKARRSYDEDVRALVAFDSAHEELRQRLVIKQKVRVSLAEEVTPLATLAATLGYFAAPLDGEVLPLEEALQRWQLRRRYLQELWNFEKEWSRACQVVAEQEAQASAAANELQACYSETPLLVAARSLARAKHEAAVERLRAAEWRWRFHEERRLLGDGEPCPLCGSEAHPWAGKVDDSLEAEIQALREAVGARQAEIDWADEQWAKAERLAAGVEARQAQLDELLTRSRPAAAAAHRAFSQLLSGMFSGELELESATRESIEALGRDARSGVERAELQLAERGKALERLAHLRKELAEVERDVAELAAQVHERELARERRQADVLGVAERARMAAAQICRVTQLVETAERDFEDELLSWHRRVEAWRGARAALDAAALDLRREEREVVERAEAIALRRALADEAEGEWKQVSQELATAEARAAELLPSVPDLDHWEAGRRQALVEVEDATEAIRRRVAEQLQNEALIRGQWEAAVGDAAAAEVRAAAAKGELESQLKALGFLTAKELEAVLLAEPERERLERYCSELDLRQARHEAQRQSLSERLAAAGDGGLGELTGGALQRRLTELRELAEAELQTLTAELQQIDQSLGAIRSKQEQQAQLAERRSNLGAELVAEEATHAIWAQLHLLIGRREGEQFQRFAQLLNFQDLLQRANVHLAALSARYRLVSTRDKQGQPSMDFSVRDLFQGEVERSARTLSGGESFLVSLALALGLASYSERRFPVETLLLDEGFGTLDRDSLAMALRVLDQLQARGTQVGIISHVEAISEWVPAKILVERVGAGRSRVRTISNEEGGASQ